MVKSASIVIALFFSFPAHAENEPPPPQLHIVIDAGHGGTDLGTQKGANIEKEMTLSLATEIENRLKDRPQYITVLTRRGDHLLSFDERRRIANTNSPGVYVSLHFGIHSKIYVLPPSGKGGAGLLIPIDQAHDSAASESIRWGGLLAETLKPTFPDIQLGMAPFPLASLVGVTLPAVLVEFEFSKTPEEAGGIATQIVQAIDRWASAGNNPAP